MVKSNLIAFQGEIGANSDLACRHVLPELETLPCESFEQTFDAVKSGKAKYALIPIDNSVAGRVADIHQLLPNSGLYIIGEHFQRVEHHLLAVPSSKISDLTHVHSHIHALNQCKNFLLENNIKPIIHVDTAAAARDIADRKEKTHGAIATKLAGQIYGLKSIKANVEDAAHNTTRFILMSSKPMVTKPGKEKMVTSLFFRVRNVPAALYKSLGGFATNGINMTKLESYIVGGEWFAAQFYADVEGHPDERSLSLALEELSFFSSEVKILGTYPAHPFRLSLKLK